MLVVADDALVFGVGESDEKTRADHDRNLRDIFTRIRKVGIRLNKKKLQLATHRVVVKTDHQVITMLVYQRHLNIRALTFERFHRAVIKAKL